jgi:hypothetical protein
MSQDALLLALVPLIILGDPLTDAGPIFLVADQSPQRKPDRTVSGGPARFG